MLFEDLAREYAGLNIYVEDTRKAAIRAAKLFDARGECSVEDLNLDAVITFKEETLKVAKVVSFNGYLKYLRLITDYAVREGYLETNYFRKVKTGPEDAVSYKVISDTDIWLTLRHISENSELYSPSWFWQTVVITLMLTGIRRRQLVNIKCCDIDFSGGNLLLRKEGSKTRKEWSIPIHPQLKTALANYIKKVEADLGYKLKADDPLFNVCRHNPKYRPSPNNPRLMQPESITGFFKRVNKRTGLNVSAHKFRHTIASKLCNPSDGMPDIFSTQVLLGHSQVKTTRSYVTTPLERVEKTLNTLNFNSLLKNYLTG